MFGVGPMPASAPPNWNPICPIWVAELRTQALAAPVLRVGRELFQCRRGASLVGQPDVAALGEPPHGYFLQTHAAQKDRLGAWDRHDERGHLYARAADDGTTFGDLPPPPLDGRPRSPAPFPHAGLFCCLKLIRSIPLLGELALFIGASNVPFPREAVRSGKHLRTGPTRQRRMKDAVLRALWGVGSGSP